MDLEEGIFAHQDACGVAMWIYAGDAGHYHISLCIVSLRLMHSNILLLLHFLDAHICRYMIL